MGSQQLIPFSSVSIVDFEQLNVGWEDKRTATFGYCCIAFITDRLIVQIFFANIYIDRERQSLADITHLFTFLDENH